MRIFCVLFLAILIFPAISRSEDEGAEIEPRADKLLRQMSEYLDTLEQFTIHTENSIDTLLSSGQKLQLGRAVDVFVRRPDRFRANIKGDLFDQELYFDGKSITLYGKKVNYYANVEAPPTIEEAINHAEQSFGLVAPLADLIFKNCYDILTNDVQSGFYVGLSTVLGVECHHLAFRAEETDWQIWIENSDRPLPRKFLITSKWVASAPQFTGLLTKWDVSPQIKENHFSFIVPEGAQRIAFLPAEDE